MKEVLLIGGMFAVTFGIRYALWGTAGRFRFPPWLSDALGFVPPAVLTAIIVPAVLIPDGRAIHAGLDNPYLIAAVASLAIALWRRNLLVTIVFGMTLFMVLKWGIGL
ncbi:AzlD domain-containing protein [Motiliproteus sp. SC1-56]|uniref:AzlD domain-containing protein n=1 Tax=Motiliproteus sp. SC1-56 TaxID=2799565 RepID=UPI001A8C9C62|nr:AzlD domain-containing protein [Motiliproteus sp. SC1-56]